MEITDQNLIKREKLIINVAITGAVHGPDVMPDMPCKPKEQIQSAYECYNAGATMVHIHVRDDENLPTDDIERYQEVVAGVQAKCPGMITQIGVAQAGVRPTAKDPRYKKEFFYQTPPEVKIETMQRMNPKPDMWTIAMGTTGMITPPAPQLKDAGRDVFLYFPPSFVEKQMEVLQERGIEGQFEIAHLSWIQTVKEFVAAGHWKRPLHFELLHGARWGWNSADPRNLLHGLALLPEETCTWSVLGIGLYQLPITTMAILLGGDVRVGFEDNIYYRKGEMAKSNAQLVERTVRIAKEVQREIASPEEARKIMKIGEPV
ncbi:MAG: 3-keto-5-aminohexanoate cleavage protein [candidate division WOR-3 bacterium]